MQAAPALEDNPATELTGSYDHLWDKTVVLSIEDAAVRTGQEDDGGAPAVGETAVPGTAGRETGDPDTAGQGTAVPAPPSAPSPAGLIDSVPWATGGGRAPAPEVPASFAGAQTPPSFIAVPGSGEAAEGDHDGQTILKSDLPTSGAQQAGQGQEPGQGVGAGTGPLVLARVCPGGHANPPTSGQCFTCGAQLPDVAVQVPRPLGRLRLSTGELIELEQSLVIGRQPSVSRVQGGPCRGWSRWPVLPPLAATTLIERTCLGRRPLERWGWDDLLASGRIVAMLRRGNVCNAIIVRFDRRDARERRCAAFSISTLTSILSSINPTRRRGGGKNLSRYLAAFGGVRYVLIGEATTSACRSVACRSLTNASWLVRCRWPGAEGEAFSRPAGRFAAGRGVGHGCLGRARLAPRCGALERGALAPDWPARLTLECATTARRAASRTGASAAHAAGGLADGPSNRRGQGRQAGPPGGWAIPPQPMCATRHMVVRPRFRSGLAEHCPAWADDD